MTALFLKILNMSLSAGYLVLAVLLLRLLLKKAPKWITVLLWGLVAVRLACPISWESVLSLIPSAEPVNPGIMTDQAPSIQSGIPILNNTLNPIIGESLAPDYTASINPLQIWIPILSAVWLVGALAMVVYMAASYLSLRHKVGTAVRLRENLWQSERVDSPFVLGLLRPRIYLPFDLDDATLAHVVAHEQAHVRRRDHLWKSLGFLLLAIHWFNPLVWLSYLLLCRDIELACDERVIRALDLQSRADYSRALLSCSVNRRRITACPLAFGEVGVKDRVKSVLNYKKPAFWIIVLALVACVAVGVCFLTNPRDDEAPGTPETGDAAPLPSNPGESDPDKLNDAQKALFERCPEYFGLDAANGLDVYVWQMAAGTRPAFGLRVRSEHAGAYELDSNELWIKGVSAEEMRTILSTYTVDPANVRIVFWQPLHSSYLPDWMFVRADEDAHTKRAGYAEVVHAMLYEPTEPRPLTISALRALVYFYGEELTWSHFTHYAGESIGSGLHIIRYPIDANYSLWIGGDGHTKPLYVRLVFNPLRLHSVDVRTESISQFLTATQSTTQVPDEFSFSLNWGVEGIAAYDSRTGALTNDVRLSKSKDHTTYHTLPEDVRLQIYNLLVDLLSRGDYPDTYDPENGFSEPSMTLVLTVRMVGGEKTIRAEDIAMFEFSSPTDERAQRFLNACQAIQGYLESTEEWKALPPILSPFE